MSDDESSVDSILSDIYQIRVSIIDSKPWIWRRIHISADSEVTDLGTAIMQAVGWMKKDDGTEFRYDCEFLRPEPDDRCLLPGNDIEGIVHSKFKIKVLFEKWGNPVRFKCSNKDQMWLHLINREKIVPRAARKLYPICIRGSHACPPEDCKNIEDYHKLLKIMKDPKHPMYDKRADIIKKLEAQKFNPKRFHNPGYVGASVSQFVVPSRFGSSI